MSTETPVPAPDLLGAVRRKPNGKVLAVLWPSPPSAARWMTTDAWGSCGYETDAVVADWPVVGAVPYSPAAGFPMPTPTSSLFPLADQGEAETADPKTFDRDAEIAYMTGWAARYGAALNLEGECGFGRECVGIDLGGTWIDYGTADYNGGIWTPEDAYHKHPCVAVLGRGEEAVEQLAAWVHWLDDHGYGIEMASRTSSGGLDLLIHGTSTPTLVVNASKPAAPSSLPDTKRETRDV